MPEHITPPGPAAGNQQFIARVAPMFSEFGFSDSVSVVRLEGGGATEAHFHANGYLNPSACAGQAFR